MPPLTKILIACILLLACGCFALNCVNSNNVQSITGSYDFLAYGHLFNIDPYEMSITLLYSFDPKAPSVALSPEGLFWARFSEKDLAAFNPRSGKIEATVSLPLRPYNHIITPNGKAYVTHHTLTDENFTVSIIDTYKKKFVRQIEHISGLRTDIIHGNGYVYLATIGINRTDNLYLYQIDTQSDQLREIYNAQKKDCFWRVSYNSDSLYMCHLNLPKRSTAPIIGVMDISKRTICRTISNLPGIKEILDKVTFDKDRAFLPCFTTDDHYGIAILEPSSGKISRILNVTGAIYRIIGIKDDILIYIDNPAKTGDKGMSLYFYDLKEEKEVKTINISQFLEANK